MCAEHIFQLFEQAQPADDRQRTALEAVRAWACAEMTITQARTATIASFRAAQGVIGATREAALSTSLAAAVAHVAAHELGAAAYAIHAVRAASPEEERQRAGRLECRWPRAQLPLGIRELVLDHQKLRNAEWWFVFDDWSAC